TLKTIEADKLLITVGAHDIEKKEPRQITYRCFMISHYSNYHHQSLIIDIACQYASQNSMIYYLLENDVGPLAGVEIL
ncbi:hypothetical protein D917_07412, partial [Trichinella nativa]